MVVMPYTRLNPATVAAIPGARLAQVSGRDGYWMLLSALWELQAEFTLVEHDIVPREDSLTELAGCERDWCAFAYDCGGLLLTGLGCTKFSAALQARQPDALSRIAPEQRYWDGLDAVVIGELHLRGEQEHVHEPPVAHHHWEGVR